MAMRKALSELILATRTRAPLDGAVERAALHVAVYARDEGMRAEEMIVHLKKEWLEITGPGKRAADETLRDTQAKLISEAIRSYYELTESGPPSTRG
jgi:hypothetical protein